MKKNRFQYITFNIDDVTVLIGNCDYLGTRTKNIHRPIIVTRRYGHFGGHIVNFLPSVEGSTDTVTQKHYIRSSPLTVTHFCNTVM